MLYKRSLYALARVSGTAFRAGADIPKSLIKGVIFTFELIVFQLLLGAVILHSLCCITHCHSDAVFNNKNK